MPSIRVPDTGLILESSAASGNPVPPQAFTINLSDNVLEDLIKCVQSGEDLQLSLGSSPVSNHYCFALHSENPGHNPIVSPTGTTTIWASLHA